jgi:Rhodanese-like domain
MGAPEHVTVAVPACRSPVFGSAWQCMTSSPSSTVLAAAAPSAGGEDISRAEVVRRLRDGTLIVVDVLPAESYAAGHIPGARSLPLAEVAARAREVLPERNAEIAVYCGGFT